MTVQRQILVESVVSNFFFMTSLSETSTEENREVRVGGPQDVCCNF
jgi:hypothetical protein